MAKTSKSSDSAKPVGYRNPPLDRQIKEGEVRNPWGRKGKPRPKVDFLDEPFELRFDGKTITVPRKSAVDYALFNAALAGKVSAAQELERRRRERALAAKMNADEKALSSEDEAALDRYIERRLKETQREREGGDAPPEPDHDFAPACKK